MRAERTALLADPRLVGAPLRAALCAAYDGWLAELFGAPGPGVALVAVGALGRRDVVAGSDLDLVLVHDGRRPDVAMLAESLWYPIWDSGVGLDHSVRTVEQAREVARGDLKAVLGLLESRPVAGDAGLAAELGRAVRADWRTTVRRRLPELRELGRERAAAAGEVAFLLEPDLKDGRGGLRDVQALRALSAAQLTPPPAAAVLEAEQVLLDARGELHRRLAGGGRRAVDRLLLQEQDAVAAALAYPDADALMAAVAAAARTVAHALDAAWRAVLPPAPDRPRWGRRRVPERRPLAADVVEQAGEVVLARDADPAGDPALVLRVGAAAAGAALPIAAHTLDRLRSAPPLPQPWPAEAREALVALLGAGRPAVAVLEDLDQAGLLVPLLPEWAAVRNRPQRNSFHRFTVDRHLVEAAAHAAELTRRVSRPDLLLLGALLHDIGKGLPGDHTEAGIGLVSVIGPRLGLPAADVQVLVSLVRHHLLLPDVATRRDLADPATAAGVAAAVGSRTVLELLHALTEADAAATGPAAWSAWKATLVDDLVRRTAALLAGTPPPPPAPVLQPWQQELVDSGGPGLAARGDEVTVAAPDRPGLLSLSAGILALHRLDVRSAAAFSIGRTAVAVFRVAARFGSLPDWTLVQADLRNAVAGTLPLAERLAARERAYAVQRRSAAPPAVRLVDDASERATVLEVRAPDAAGLLHRVTRELGDCGLDVRTAHISTMGADVVDAFYVVGRDGGKLVDSAVRDQVVRRLLVSLASQD